MNAALLRTGEWVSRGCLSSYGGLAPGCAVLTRILTRPSSDPLAPRGGGGPRAPVQHTDRTCQHTRLLDTLRSARSCQRAKALPD